MRCQRQMQVYSLVFHVYNISTHFGPLTPYDNIELGQPWAKQMLAAWRLQAITCINVGSS